ncbi:MAG TPA: aminotransferase class IV [Prolixibacteraceae bacterium]|jgi:branched-chain amino acid aminotransferase
MDFVVTQNGIIPQDEMNVRQFNTGHPVYEVIRVVDGIALFLEDHYERLLSSLQIRGLQFEMEFSEFKQNITELTKINQKQNGNVKFILTSIGKINHWFFSYIAHSYPTSNDYQKGVTTGLLIAERENPNAKVIQNTIRERVDQLIKDEKLYEALLVDRNGMITEGSRSNVFFVKGNRFYTAPASKVLVGVTRQKVLECLDELNFTIIEEAVSTSGLGAIDAVFLTGTSPKVLPVNRIDTFHFSAKNTFVEQLIDRYDLMVETYLKERRL